MAKRSPLHMRSRDWAFLADPQGYVRAYAGVHSRGRQLDSDATARQFATAKEILKRFTVQKGVLLADDVGLGKTLVAALVACVFAGRGRRVRILAPNAVMERRWREEIRSHLEPLGRSAGGLDLSAAMGRSWKRLGPGRIVVSSHYSGRRLECDLLIVDEVHRARNEGSQLAVRLHRQREGYGRLLFLTATPFSIDAAGLARMLRRIDAAEAAVPTKRFAEKLQKLWLGDVGGDPLVFAEDLAQLGCKAARAIHPYVIRHSVEGLQRAEVRSFGHTEQWPASPPPANASELKFLLHLDRVLELAKVLRIWPKTRTNDPRYHVGYAQARDDLTEVAAALRGARGPEEDIQIARWHVGGARRHLRASRVHPKVASTVAAVKEIVRSGEKVVVFCHHHSSAQEIALALHGSLPAPSPRTARSHQLWLDAWRMALLAERAIDDSARGAVRRRSQGFIGWLASPGMRAQVAGWLVRVASDPSALAHQLRRARARRHTTCGTIAREAAELLRALDATDSKSTQAVLADADRRNSPQWIPGGGETATRVVAACEFPRHFTKAQADVFFDRQPDTVMGVFNSPFGPEVLVATDRLSEGIDLHRFCRHVIHHELDPSPIRTIQRNGRLRRVRSWAARTRMPLLIAYPAHGRTRDQRLVDLMRQRLQQFDLVLGGIREPIVTDGELDGALQEQILELARPRLRTINLAVRRSR